MRSSLTAGLLAPCLLMLLLSCGRVESTRRVSGQLQLSTFQDTPTSVRAIRPGSSIQGEVASDGRFKIELSRGAGYRIVFTTAKSDVVLVSPRSDRSFTSVFNVRGGGISELGQVRYWGNPTLQTYAFHASNSNARAECEDGKDATGAVCVVDDAEGGGACEADDDNVECENGVDPTRQPCADEPDSSEAETAATASETSDTDGLECEDGVDAVTGVPCADDDDSPSEAAVADKSLSTDLGCVEEEDAESED